MYSSILLFLSITLTYSYALKLRGCYVESEPHIFGQGTSGYGIDVLNGIAQKAGFSYELSQPPDGKYGIQRDDGFWNGMIGEVVRKVADFAIADITITPQRANVIDFTQPILNMSIGALISKSHSEGINSFKDLSLQTNVKYGMIGSGSTMNLFQTSNNPILRSMYSYMQNHTDTFVRSITQGIVKVKTEPFAFIGESSTIEYHADINCDLKAISGQEYDQRQYAFVLQKGSRYLEAFNKAINEMRDSGELETLRKKYWNKKCLASNANIIHFTSISLMICFFALIAKLF